MVASVLLAPIMWESLDKDIQEKEKREEKKLIPLPILPLPATDEPKKKIIATLF